MFGRSGAADRAIGRLTPASSMVHSTVDVIAYRIVDLRATRLRIEVHERLLSRSRTHWGVPVDLTARDPR
jgi:hypothetical protein